MRPASARSLSGLPLNRRLPVSNNALITPDGKFGMLQTWVECVQRSGVKNFLVIALDEHTGAPPLCSRRPGAQRPC